jgi:hypothetical protein
LLFKHFFIIVDVANLDVDLRTYFSFLQIHPCILYSSLFLIMEEMVIFLVRLVKINVEARLDA